MKTVLVIDIPMTLDGKHLCNHCPVWSEDMNYCNYRFFYGGNEKGCPLKPLPKKKQLKAKPEAEGYNPWVQGWNDCLDEINA